MTHLTNDIAESELLNFVTNRNILLYQFVPLLLPLTVVKIVFILSGNE